MSKNKKQQQYRLSFSSKVSKKEHIAYIFCVLWLKIYLITSIKINNRISVDLISQELRNVGLSLSKISIEGGCVSKWKSHYLKFNILSKKIVIRIADHDRKENLTNFEKVNYNIQIKDKMVGLQSIPWDKVARYLEQDRNRLVKIREHTMKVKVKKGMNQNHNPIKDELKKLNLDELGCTISLKNDDIVGSQEDFDGMGILKVVDCSEIVTHIIKNINNNAKILTHQQILYLVEEAWNNKTVKRKDKNNKLSVVIRLARNVTILVDIENSKAGHQVIFRCYINAELKRIYGGMYYFKQLDVVQISGQTLKDMDMNRAIIKLCEDIRYEIREDKKGENNAK